MIAQKLTHIRVADAPLVAAAPSRSERFAAVPVSENVRNLAIGLLCYVVINFSTYLINEHTPLFSGMVIVRYLLWPTIIVAAIWSWRRRGIQAFANLTIFTPYFAIGVIAGIFGVDPLMSMRLLVMWLFGVIAAAVVSNELDWKSASRTLFYLYLVMMATSLIAVYIMPITSTSLDGREHERVWIGLFPHKNWFGLMATYCFLLALISRSEPIYLRLIAAIISIIEIKNAHSIGAVLMFVNLLFYMIFRISIGSLKFPAAIKACMLVGVFIIGGIFVALWFEPLVLMLGRDPTLTGRTYFWPVWLARALENWPIGSGPGSFTEPGSAAATDITAQFTYYGEIHSPHNMFIAVFGEVGIFGVIAFFGPLLYIAFLMPFREVNAASRAAGAIAFTTLMSGLVETREVFGTGFNIMLVIIFYGLARNYALHAGPDDTRAPS